MVAMESSARYFFTRQIVRQGPKNPFARDRLKLIFPEGPKGVGEGGLLSTVVDKKAHNKSILFYFYQGQLYLTTSITRDVEIERHRNKALPL